VSPHPATPTSITPPITRAPHIDIFYWHEPQECHTSGGERTCQGGGTALRVLVRGSAFSNLGEVLVDVWRYATTSNLPDQHVWGGSTGTGRGTSFDLQTPVIDCNANGVRGSRRAFIIAKDMRSGLVSNRVEIGIECPGFGNVDD